MASSPQSVAEADRRAGGEGNSRSLLYKAWVCFSLRFYFKDECFSFPRTLRTSKL